MKIIELCEEIIGFGLYYEDLDNYWSTTILQELYFKPNNIDKNLINEKLKNKNYINKIQETYNKFKNIDICNFIGKIINNYEKDIENKLSKEILYVIIGLDTTNIYSFNYNGSNVKVLLLESIGGDLDKLNEILLNEFVYKIK